MGTEQRTVPPKDRDRADWARHDNRWLPRMPPDANDEQRDSGRSMGLGTRLGTIGRDEEKGTAVSAARRVRDSAAVERPVSSTHL